MSRFNGVKTCKMFGHGSSQISHITKTVDGEKPHSVGQKLFRCPAQMFSGSWIS